MATHFPAPMLSFRLPLLLLALASAVHAQGTRRESNGVWRLLWESTTPLETITILGVTPAGTLLSFDQGTGRLHAHTLATGQLRWQSGRLGLGPNEYQNPTAIAFDYRRNRLIINDPGASRLGILESDGRFVQHVPLSRTIHRLAQHRGRWLSWEPAAKESAYCWLDAAWNCLTHLPITSDTGRAAVLLGEPFMASGDSVTLAAASRWRGTFFVLNAASMTPVLGRSIIAPSNAQVESRSATVEGLTAVAMSIRRGSRPPVSGLTVTGSSVVLLARTDDRETPWLDYYDLADARYRHSRRLPVEASAFVLRGDTLAVFETAERGTLRTYAWTAAR